MKTLKQFTSLLLFSSLFLGCSKERIVPILTRLDSIEKAQEAYKDEIFENTKQVEEEPNSVNELVDSSKLSTESFSADNMDEISDLQDIEDFGDAKLFFDGTLDPEFTGGGIGGGIPGVGDSTAIAKDAYIKSLLPLDIKFIKLYKIGDMVLLKKHTMTDQIRLRTEGMVYLSVKKNGIEVDINKLKPRIELTSTKPLKNASLYYETKDKTYGQTWKFEEEIKSSKIKTIGDTTFYVYSPKQYGWSQIAAPYDTLSDKTSVTFVSKIPKTSTLKMFVVYPKTKSIILADTSGKTPKIPIGEKYESIVVTKTKNLDYYAFFETKNAIYNQTIDILLKKISQKALTSKLDSLK